jgi:hypothetical protein
VAGVTVDGFQGDDIQRAVDSLESGGVVQLRAGRYVLDRAVRLASGVAVVGEGAASTLIELLPGSNSHVFVNDDPARGNERIELRGFTLDGNGATQQRPRAKALAFAFGTFLWNVHHAVISDVDACDIRQSAIQLNDCRDVTVTNVRAADMGWSGVATSRTDDLIIADVDVERVGLDGVHSALHLGSGTGIYVAATVTGCTGHGIMLDSKFASTTDVVIEAVAHHCRCGVAVTGSRHDIGDVLVAGDFSNNRECGVFISNASNVFVLGAKLELNGEAGVVLQGSKGGMHCLIADCVISGSPTSIVERDASRDNYQARNTIVDAEPQHPSYEAINR